MSALFHHSWLYRSGNEGQYLRFEITGKLSESPYWMERRPGLIAPVIGWEAR
jgi:lipopolysaccharide transport system ATP-binding protein